MPIQPPVLDDLRYDRIVEQLLRRIPAYAPEWTDWNDSDPGVTLIQLFATLAEQVGYRLNQVPERNYIELLKLLGIRLRPALAARARIALFLSSPATLSGFVLDARSRFMAKGATAAAPAAIFESDADFDVVPADTALLVTTRNPFLWDLRLLADGTREPDPTDAQLPPKIPASDCRWLSVAWDGKKPAAKDMPLAPVTLLPASPTGVDHPWLWVGLRANLARDAGFVGVTVTLCVQLDDDELPDARADISCAPIDAAGERQPPAIDWLWYWDADAAAMKPIVGRIDDATDRLTRSGTLRFSVPFTVGPIPAASFVDLRDAVVPAPIDACSGLAQNVRDALVPGGACIDPTQLQTLLTNALTAAQAAKAAGRPAVAHPLDPVLRDPGTVVAWLRIGTLDTTRPSPRLRHLGFNVVAVTNAVTVASELLGRGDGRPGQVFQLAHGNVLDGTLQVGVQEDSDPKALLSTWSPVASLDPAGPDDRRFEFDPEAGSLLFGDGRRGRILPLVPGAGMVVALRYRWGGGVAGERDVGAIATLGTQCTGIAGVTNIVAARGGRDAESLDAA